MSNQKSCKTVKFLKVESPTSLKPIMADHLADRVKMSHKEINEKLKSCRNTIQTLLMKKNFRTVSVKVNVFCFCIYLNILFTLKINEFEIC